MNLRATGYRLQNGRAKHRRHASCLCCRFARTRTTGRRFDFGYGAGLNSQSISRTIAFATFVLSPPK